MREAFQTSRGYKLAVRRKSGQAGVPTAVWLSGFHSDMAGTKAQALEAWAVEGGHGWLALDYFGHGESEGDFADGTIGLWRQDVLDVLDAYADGPVVLVGSSMGGWMALLAALARPDIVKGLVLIAPAPDFTEALMWAGFPEPVKRQIMEEGSWQRPTQYGEDPYPITRALIEDGREHCLLGGPIPFSGPVRILHGMADADVPWQHGKRLADALESDDVTLTLVKGGDHRLSAPRDIARLVATVSGLIGAL